MSPIGVLQRFLSLILAPTPFADLFVSNSLFIVDLPAAFVATLAADSPTPTLTITAAGADSQEPLAVADVTETTHLFVAPPAPAINPPPTLAAPMIANLTIPAITISCDEDSEDLQSVSTPDEDDHFWELSSDSGSDISSTPSSVTSDDMAEEPKAFFTFHANVSIEDIQLYPDGDNCVDRDSEDSRSHETDIPALPAPPPTFVASSIPRQVYIMLEEEKVYSSTPELPQIALESINDIDDIGDYNVRSLTAHALTEAKSRSRKIQRTARMRQLDLVKVVPLKAHEHPEPRSLLTPSVLKGMGHSSPLRNSFNMEDLEEDARQEAVAESCLAEEEEDELPELQDLTSFFKKRS